MIIKECRDCDLGFNHNYIPIKSIGDLNNAKVFIVFYSPDIKDVELKEKVITKYITKLYFDLKIVNFQKEDIYITFLLKCKNNLKSKIPDEAYLQKCNKHFQEELNRFQHGIVILVGHKVINYILGDKFYLIRDFGKLLKNNKFCFINLPALNHLFNNKESTIKYQEMLVEAYQWYRNNININHKSIYHVIE
jgi:uracil-DNA glycosylase